MPISVSDHKKTNQIDFSRFSDFIIKYQNAIVIFSLAVIVICGLNITKIQLNDDPIGYFSDEVPIRQAYLFMENHLSGTQNISFSLNTEKQDGIYDIDYLNEVGGFVSWLRSQPEVENVESFTDTLKRLNQVVHADEEEYYRLPDSSELAAQLILMYELSLPYGLDLNNQINVDKSALKLSFIVSNLKSRGLIEIENRAASWLSENAPSIATRGASKSLMSANIGQRNIENMIYGSLLAILLISASLIFSLKSFRYGLLSLVPNLVPAIVTFGVWGLLVGEVNMAASVVFSLSLGIIVDDTIHFLMRYIRGRRDEKLSPEDAVKYAFASVGKALIVTSIVLSGGFLVLAASDFVVNSLAGLLVASTLLVAIIFDLLFLPVLLLKVDRWLDRPIND